MKTTIVILTAVCLAGGAWLVLPRTRPAANAVAERSQTTDPASTPVDRRDLPAERPTFAENAAERPATRNSQTTAEQAGAGIPQPNTSAAASLPFKQALSTLTSVEAAYAQKQAAWQQLKDSGKLDLAITELEQQAAANPNVAEVPAALGQAYLQKAGTLSDIREQGILGMKADQSFDAALNLDPGNWEAGFWKAVAMSYWPPQLGKGQEVIERFVNLVKLQETQSTQPQFAQTYLLLGEQYQKQGYDDYARQIWQRGAALFPAETKFNEKLTHAVPSQTAAR